MEHLDAFRPLLFSIAYRMLGSASDAEDIVQETFTRYTARTDQHEVRSPKALLTTIATNLCLDQLKSARVRRERYIGPWLPEPLLTDSGLTESPVDTVEQRESVSLGFLMLLERLSPAERAVFVLREAFEYSYDEIGLTLGKSAQACRQLHHRADRRLADGQVRFASPPDTQRLIVDQFLAAANGGDVIGLVGMLATDAQLITDGGGKAAAALRPIIGAERVVRFLQNLPAREAPGTRNVPADINGQPGHLTLVNGEVQYATVYEIANGRIQTIRSIGNPDKLAFLARQLNTTSYSAPRTTEPRGSDPRGAEVADNAPR